MKFKFLKFEKKKNITIFLLLLIIFLGVSLRLYLLGDKNFSFDETFYPAERINRLPFWEVEINGIPYPPLWSAFTYWTTGYTLNETWLRLPSALFGILTIIFVYLTIGLVYNKNVALLSSLLLAVSPLGIYVSQDLKPYSFLSFVFILSFYFFIKVLKEDKPINWIFFVLTAASTLYTHWYMFFYLLFMNLYFVINFKKYRKLLFRWIYSQVAIFILLVPLIFYAIIQPHVSLEKMTLKSAILTLPYIFHGFSFGEVSPYMVEYNLNTKHLFLYFPLLLFYFYFFIKGLKLKKDNLMLLVLSIPVAMYLISFFFPLQIVPKRVSFASFAFYAIISNGLFSIKNKKLFNVFLLVFIFSSFFSLTYYYYNFDKEDWKGASNLLISNFEEGDVIGFMTSEMRIVLDYQFAKYKVSLPVEGIPTNTSFTDRALKLKPEDTPTRVTEKNVRNLDNITKGHKRLWLVQTRENNPHADPEGLVKKYLDIKYKLLLNKNLTGIKIYLYELQ